VPKFQGFKALKFKWREQNLATKQTPKSIFQNSLWLASQGLRFAHDENTDKVA